MKPKIKIYIDGTWLTKNRGTLAHNLGRELKINFGALEALLLAQAVERLGIKEYTFAGTSFFGSVPANYDKQDEAIVKKQLSFYDILQNVFHFKVHLFDIDFKQNRILKTDRPSSVILHEKCVDTAISSAIVEEAMANIFDVCVLVAGDKDFSPALATARRHGKRVVLASVYGACAYEYTHGQFVDARVVWLDRFLEVIERKREYSCSAVYHPVALPKAFLRPEVLGTPEAYHCPLCANLTKALRLQNRLPEVVTKKDCAHAQTALVGKVTKVVAEKGFGFITAKDNRNFFFHVSDTAGIAWDSIKCGLGVFFEVTTEPTASKAGKCVKIRPAFGTV